MAGGSLRIRAYAQGHHGRTAPRHSVSRDDTTREIKYESSPARSSNSAPIPIASPPLPFPSARYTTLNNTYVIATPGPVFESSTRPVAALHIFQSCFFLPIGGLSLSTPALSQSPSPPSLDFFAIPPSPPDGLPVAEDGGSPLLWPPLLFPPGLIGRRL